MRGPAERYKTLVRFNQTLWRHILEGNSLHVHIQDTFRAYRGKFLEKKKMILSDFRKFISKLYF